MKKVLVMVVALLMLCSVASADGLYWNEYNPEAPVQYVVCGYDAEEDACFTAVVDIFELVNMASANAIFSAYAVDVDGVYEIDWDWSEDGLIFRTIDCHGCEVEYIDM